jgi:hypothetical protein
MQIFSFSMPSSTSSLVMHRPLMPLIATARLSATMSIQPQRRGRPVVAPYSWPRSRMPWPHGVVQFGRERAAADARGVGLGDAEHVVDRVRADAGAGQRAADGGVGRGDVGIGAVVDVEQRALRALEQHRLPCLAQVVQDAGHVGLHRLDVLAEKPAPRPGSAGSRPHRPSGTWVSTKLW